MAHSESFVQSLTDILVKQKVITAEHAQELQRLFADSPKEYFDDFLLEEGFVEESDLLRALSAHYQVPACDASGQFFEHFLLRKFPKDFLLRNGVIPLIVDNDELVVIASEPDREGLESLMRDFVSYDIVFEVGLRRDITDAIEEFYDISNTEEDFDEDLYDENLEEEGFHEVLAEEGEDEEKD